MHIKRKNLRKRLTGKIKKRNSDNIRFYEKVVQMALFFANGVILKTRNQEKPDQKP